MNKKILADMDFASIISESYAQTQTGAELLNRYKAFVMNNDVNYSLVNNFIKEAQLVRYDNGVNEALELVSDYVTENKTIWALASVCESINANTQSYNYLNRNAAHQVEKLLEMDENDVVKYIKAGALKNVMFCESFRNIAKQVYKDTPMVEATADYVVAHPISIVENVGDGLCFEVNGCLYKMADDKTIQESQWNTVSNTFKTITQLLESNLTTVDEQNIKVKAGNAEYTISEANKVTKIGKEGTHEYTIEQLRDNNRLVLMATNARHRNQLGGVLEAIALTCENFDHIVSLDNVSIYNTKHDRFMVIEAGDDLYATLLQSNHNTKWTINENAVDALSFIKSKTNVTLSEVYKEQLQNSIEKISEEEQEKLAKELDEQKKLSYKERIETLTERFKNDPVKLTILSKLAQDLQSAE